MVRDGPRLSHRQFWLPRPQEGSSVPETVFCQLHFTTTLQGPRDVPVPSRATVTYLEARTTWSPVTHWHSKHLLSILTSV